MPPESPIHEARTQSHGATCVLKAKSPNSEAQRWPCKVDSEGLPFKTHLQGDFFLLSPLSRSPLPGAGSPVRVLMGLSVPQVVQF